MGAVDAIKLRRGWKHRKWRKAMMALCCSVSDGPRIPRQSALYCIRVFEAKNGFQFDPLNEGHSFLVHCYARYARFHHCGKFRRHPARSTQGKAVA